MSEPHPNGKNEVCPGYDSKLHLLLYLGNVKSSIRYQYTNSTRILSDINWSYLLPFQLSTDCVHDLFS